MAVVSMILYLQPDILVTVCLCAHVSDLPAAATSSSFLTYPLILLRISP